MTTTLTFLFAFAPPTVEIGETNISSSSCRMTRTETYIASTASFPSVGVWAVPQETIEEASAAASTAKKIALSAFTEFISCAVYRRVLGVDEEVQASGICFTAAGPPEILRLLRLASSAEETYRSALMHLSSLVEVPDDDDDELLLATKGAVERWVRCL